MYFTACSCNSCAPPSSSTSRPALTASKRCCSPRSPTLTVTNRPASSSPICAESSDYYVSYSTIPALIGKTPAKSYELLTTSCARSDWMMWTRARRRRGDCWLCLRIGWRSVGLCHFSCCNSTPSHSTATTSSSLPQWNSTQRSPTNSRSIEWSAAVRHTLFTIAPSPPTSSIAFLPIRWIYWPVAFSHLNS